MAKRILIMGLPGSGKTTIASLLAEKLGADHFNADAVRNQFNDWDFSKEGRIRQSLRMRELCDASTADYAIADFVCPLPEMRNNFDAHYTVWLDTIQQGRFEDTNKLFVPPKAFDICITEMNADYWSDYITLNLPIQQISNLISLDLL